MIEGMVTSSFASAKPPISIFAYAYKIILKLPVTKHTGNDETGTMFKAGAG
jgi:hypothetical protein